MRLNEKKCKEIVITFLKYQPSPVPPICMFLNGAAIARVSSFKLLGVTLSNCPGTIIAMKCLRKLVRACMPYAP